MIYKYLGDIAEIKGGKRMPKGTRLQQEKNQHPYLRITDYDGKSFDRNSIRYVPDEVFEKISNYTVTEGDIFLSIVGTIGIATTIDKEYDNANLTENAVKIIPDESVNSKYILYFLQSMLGQRQMNELSVGSTQKKLPIKNIKKIKILLPNLEIQNKVVSNLQILDKKIALNNQINDNLDALLTNIFKKYMINDGFEKSNLTQIANYKNGLAMQKYRPNSNEESLPVLKIKELNQGNTDDSSDRCSANLDNSVIVNTGDIIFSWSGTLLVKNWTGDKAGLNQHLFKVTSNKYPAWFIYEWTKYHLLRFQAIAAGKATTMGHIKRSDLKSSLVYIPSQVFLAKMDSQLAPIYSQRLNLIKENQQLSKLKQTLLKKYF